ncbi:hypothetical protein GF373_00515 [bacterium]|nr:hypothetical protein [bacterium]
MNWYVVVEGDSEKKIYKKWIPFVNPHMTYIDSLRLLTENNFYVISGGGYPNYLETIDDAIEDINSVGQFDRFIVVVDAEEMAFTEKQQELIDYLSNRNIRAELYLIIQNFCIETWGLGNLKIAPRNPNSPTLQKYKNHYDVSVLDPEDLPKMGGLTRAQFAYKYLKAMLKDKHNHLYYTKRNPRALMHETFLHEIKKRYLNTNHIQSFKTFLEAVEN